VDKSPLFSLKTFAREKIIILKRFMDKNWAFDHDDETHPNK
jgi:hypothetical protein